MREIFLFTAEELRNQYIEHAKNFCQDRQDSEKEKRRTIMAMLINITARKRGLNTDLKDEQLISKGNPRLMPAVLPYGNITKSTAELLSEEFKEFLNLNLFEEFFRNPFNYSYNGFLDPEDVQSEVLGFFKNIMNFHSWHWTDQMLQDWGLSKDAFGPDNEL